MPKIATRISETHFLTWPAQKIKETEKHKLLEASEWAFFKSLGDDKASHVTIVSPNIGWFRFSIIGRFLAAQGTWINPSYRKQGYALRLWNRALSEFNPRKVWVIAASKNGGNLIHSLENKHPHIKWIVAANKGG